MNNLKTSETKNVKTIHHNPDFVPTKTVEEMKIWCERWIKPREKVEWNVFFSVFEEKYGVRNITKFSVALEELLKEGRIIVGAHWREIIWLT